jgi:hypothetical protein
MMEYGEVIMLKDEQRARAVEALSEYLAAPSSETGKTFVQVEAEFDARRVKLIEKELKPLLAGYLNGSVDLSEFKSKIDGINKRNELWGFKGIKGQMFFNMVVNVADHAEECDQELKAAIAVPTSEQIASSRIKTFQSYVRRLGEQWVANGNTRYGAPKVGSIPFFLSYFWQVQDRDAWPIYYTNTVQTLSDLNIWQPSEDLATDYIDFMRIHEELAKLFGEKANRNFTLYDVEHVFWLKGGNPYQAAKQDQKDEPQQPQSSTKLTMKTTYERLPESYVPPIIAVLPTLALNDLGLAEAATRSGTSVARAFEKSVDAAFTVLGYDTKLMGQGQGRVPDGRALALDENYAILWDSKVRTHGYSLGTDDRAIREYISTQSRELSRRYRNIYYIIVSSYFVDDFDDTIASIKMETDISEVVLIEAEALVAIVEAKLRAPLQLTLASDGIQRLFTQSGRLTAESVREFLA